MVHDPFAVSDYPLDGLPDVRNTRRADFETDAFAPIWIEHLGGIDKASRAVLNAFDSGRWGFLEPRRMGPLEPGRPIDLTPANLSVVAHSRPATRSEELSRRLALVTLLAHADARIPKDLHRALVLELNVHSRWTKRRAASRRAQLRGHYEAKGKSTTEAVRAAQSEFGGSNGKVWAETSISIYDGLMAAAAGQSQHYPHAADPWFDAGVEDNIAQAIADESARGPLPIERRWDLLNLIEGFMRRRESISAPVLAALDSAFGLLDIDGHARRDIALGGIVERNKFIEFAREAAGEDDFDRELPAMSTEKNWESLPLFRTAVGKLSAG